MGDELVPPDGVRVVRVLEREAHLERVLVQLEGETTGVAEVVRPRGPDGADRVRHLMLVLDRLRPEGIGGLIDVFDDVHGPALIVRHQRGPSVAEVLGIRASLPAGEAVAVLAPIACAVERLHDLGVAHGSLGATRLAMCGDGLRIEGLENAELFASGAPEVVRQAVASVALDREAVRSLAADVLSRIDGPRRAAATQLVARMDAEAGPRVVRTLVEGLADLAAAVPIGRAELAPSVDAAPQGDDPPALPSPAIGYVHRVLTDLVGGEMMTTFRASLSRGRAALAGMPGGRRRLIVGGSSAIAVAAIALTALPPSSGNPPAVNLHAAPSPTQQATSGEAQRGERSESDDPAASVVALLDRRDECFRDLSVLCLDEVDQVDSEALRTDQKAVLAMREGAQMDAPLVASRDVRVVERLGDSVLVEVGPETEPASLLVMKSEAGWRIRDWVSVD